MRDYFAELYEDKPVEDGEHVRIPMMFADEQTLAAGERKLATEKAAYDERLRNAWRGPQQQRDAVVDTDEDEHARYDRRLVNAWRKR